MLPIVDVEQAVQDAATMNTPGMNDSLFEKLKGRELFFRINLSEDPETGESKLSTMPLLRLSSGQHAAVAFTSKDDAQLSGPFGGAKWEHVLDIIAKMPQADGLLIQNLRGATVALSKERIQQLLVQLGHPMIRARR